MTVFQKMYCPRCGYDQLFKRGRCLSCNTRPADVGPEIHERRPKSKRLKTELSSAETGGRDDSSLSFSAGQLGLFE
jgi:hypothetical protein